MELFATIYSTPTLPEGFYNFKHTNPRPRKVVVFGVTDPEGEAVARALLEDAGGENFTVVGIAYNLTHPVAVALKEMGVQLVQSDLKKQYTYAGALKGADGVFLSTDYWMYYMGDNLQDAKAKEIAQAREIIDEIQLAQVGHLVYSTLESCNHEIPHFESKCEISGYVKDLNIPATHLFTSAWYSDIFNAPITVSSDGGLVLHHPLPDDTVIPSYAVEQIGLWAVVAFLNPKEWIGKDMIAAGQNVTVKDFATKLSEATGRPVDTLHRTREQFLEDQGLDRAVFLQHLVMLNDEMHRDVDAARKLVPQAWDLATWLKNNAAKVADVVARAEKAASDDVKSLFSSSYQSVSDAHTSTSAGGVVSMSESDLGGGRAGSPKDTRLGPEDNNTPKPSSAPTDEADIGTANKQESDNDMPAPVPRSFPPKAPPPVPRAPERRDSLAMQMQHKQAAAIKAEQAYRSERRSSHDVWLTKVLAQDKEKKKPERQESGVSVYSTADEM